MADLYNDLYYILRDHGLRNPGHVQKLRRKSGRAGETSYELRKDLFQAMEKIYGELGSKFPETRGITLLIDASDKRTVPDVLVRKSLLFGSVTLLLVKGARCVQLERRRGGSFPAQDEYYIPSGMITLMLKYPSLVQDGLVLPIPASLKSITWSQSPYELSGLSHALPVSLKSQSLLMQLTEAEKQQNASSAGYANLLLPSLSDCSIDEVRALRHEEAESFDRFHFQLKKLLRESQAASTEDKLLQLMEETDQQVRRLHSRINTLKRTRKLKGVQMAFGLVAACLCAIAPISIGPALTGLFGTRTILDGLAFVTDIQKELAEIHQHDFYFPWKIGFGRGN